VKVKTLIQTSVVASSAVAIALFAAEVANAMAVTGFPAPTWSSTGNVAPAPSVSPTATALFTGGPIPGGNPTDATSGAFQTFLGIGAGDLDVGFFDSAFEGSALQIAVNAGDQLSFNWAFLPQSATELDYAFTVFDGTVTNLATSFANGMFDQTFAGSGLFSIGIVDIGDTAGDSILSLNGASYEPIPTPALLPGLIGFGMSIVRKRKQQQAA